jgi:hypothetical protein
MTASGPAVTLQVRDDDKVMEPYRSAIRAVVMVLSADVTTMASLSLVRSAAARSSAALMASA